MNPQHIPKPADELEQPETDDLGSVDDFIKQLEEKERDLHITSDLQIEIEDSDVQDVDISDVSDTFFASSSGGSLEPSHPGVSKEQKPSADQGAQRTAGLKTRVYELENDISKLEARINELKAERSEIQEKSDRRLKDFENFKYRMDRERRGAFIDQLANLATQMLPVMDNIERAISSVPSNDGERDASFEQFFDGVFLVNQQVKHVFSNMGVEPIITIGEPFDPNFHEAVATEERDDLPHHTIIDEMLRGYRIGNRVVRHSMVKVSVGAPNPGSRAEDEADDQDLLNAEAARSLEEAFAENDAESLEHLFESTQPAANNPPVEGPTPKSDE